jgi:hypothetical protein
MPHPVTDRNLLFGILALQMDFISRDALVAAMHAWVLDKAKPLGRILQEQGALTADTYPLLEALVQKHLSLHGNDAEQSLAAVSSAGPIHNALLQIADPDVQASLVHVAARRTVPDREPVATISLGRPTGEGLRQRFFSLLPYNVLTRAEVEKLYCEFNEIDPIYLPDIGSYSEGMRPSALGTLQRRIAWRPGPGPGKRRPRAALQAAARPAGRRARWPAVLGFLPDPPCAQRRHPEEALGGILRQFPTHRRRPRLPVATPLREAV